MHDLLSGQWLRGAGRARAADAHPVKSDEVGTKVVSEDREFRT